MNFKQRLLWCVSSLVAGGIFLPISVSAQGVTSDGTLSTKVTSPDNLNFTITNGNQPNNGANLFHSFSQFSIPTGGSATFDLLNTPNISTIFSRVTGGNISNIDGLIQTTNSSNPVSLFLLNPSGIIFGKNARLNIGGSFIATTANSIIFSDGVKFSASDRTANPLLTVNAPIGLQLEANAGAISLQEMATLQVAQGNTLALVGSQIDMTGANLTASDGRVELWATQNAQIALNNQARWQLTSDPRIVNWGNISLSQTSLVEASGTNGGAINIRGRGLTLQDGSNIRSITSAGQGKGITVQTTEFVDLMGASDIGQFAPGISTSVGILFGAPASGRAGDVTVETGSLRLSNGAWLQSSSNGDNSRSGDLTVKAADVDILGANPFLTSPTAINANLFVGTNNESGKITINAERIRVQDGGIISTALVVVSPFFRPTGKAGDILIRATESLIISGYTPDKLLSGVSSRIGATDGESGNISIDVGRLQIFNGGTVRSTLSGTGKAGNITIRAKDVTVSEPELDSLGSLPGGITVSLGANAVGSGGNISLTADSLRLFNGGQITSSTNGNGAAGSINLQVKNIMVEGISQTLSNGQILPSTIAATSSTKSDAGSVNIVSDRIDVLNRGELSVSNTGGGNAGNLSVSASHVQLDYVGSLRSQVSAGNQGNISLNTNTLVLRRGGQIDANATLSATGGNISINAPFIVAVRSENSDITANAVQGSGGNIDITTQGLFGLKFRPQLTDESDITASSQFGLSGTVNINNLTFTPTAGLIELPTDVIDPSQRIAQGCRTYGNSRFVATGRGGLPDDPSDRRNSHHPWTDLRDPSAFRNSTTLATTPQSENAKTPIVEATGWQLNAKGEVEIYAANNVARGTPVIDCAGFLAIANKSF